MTPLATRLITQINQSGPLRICDYMRICLLDPQHGYYTTRTPFGTAGDFITAPEISQMFGELVGLALAQNWLDQGAPTPFILAELGPGRGTLMADILRATKAVPGFHTAMELWLIEAAPPLRKLQDRALAGYAPHFADDISALPNHPMFLIANEFFDALPIRQFKRVGAHWHERMIGIKDGALAFHTAPPFGPTELTNTNAALHHRLADTRDGDMVETCAPGAAIMATIADQINSHGGAALVIDYGDWRSLGDTLQAVKNHGPDDVLRHPGQADLTAHVDFEALADHASPLTPARLTTQGVFLERLGITERARALAANLSGAPLETHISAHRRLTHSDEMGTLFKVLGLTPPGAPPIAGTLHDA